MNQPYRQRLRVTFARGEALKYISHLDLVRAWERALRRAGVPLAYSQGFHPQPRLAIASALPVGITGKAEVMDVFLETPLSPGDFARRVQVALPAGLEVVAVEEVRLREPSLQSVLRFSEYRVSVASNLPAREIEERIARLLAATELPRERERRGRRERYDLRLLVAHLALTGEEAGGYVLEMRLRTDQQATGRPEEVLATLGVGPAEHIERTRLIFDNSL
jgi:radical SAM-linked protein